MQHSRKIRYIIAFLLLGISVLVFVAMNVCIGTVKISLEDIIASIGGGQINNSRILWDIRMPRSMAALILGGALALAGYLLQTFFHNPIAGPFVLGISSGAKMVVALVMVFLMGQAIRVSSLTLIVAAFLGAMISMGFVLLMSHKVNNMSMLVVGGVNSIEELLDKCAVLEEFQAVQNGNVWCTTNDMYQQSMSIGYLIEDIHDMLQGEDEEEMEYLFRLE